MILIGIAGKKRTGKSTCASYLVEHFAFQQYAFATPLKRMLLAMGLRDYELEERKEFPLTRLGLSKSPRQLIQRLGTEWGRDQIDHQLWTKLADVHLRENPSTDRWVFSDVRFESEARWLRERGGVVVHILRETGANDFHESEKGIEVKKGDKVVFNTGSLDAMLTQVCVIAEFIDRNR